MRILLILGPFLLAIGGLVYLQTGLFSTQTATNTSTRTPLIQLTDVTDVVARIPEADPVSFDQAVEASIAEATQGASDETNELQALTSSVLASLGVDTAGTATLAPANEAENELRSLTQAVLAGLAQPAAQSEEDISDQPLASIISRAIREGQSSSYLDALINEASAAGQVQVPQAFINSDGRVDTATLVNSLTLARTTLQSGPLQLTQEALAQTSIGENGLRFYTVKSGDSLASLALRFYGKVIAFEALFEANRERLPNANLIRIGQKLRIPG